MGWRRRKLACRASTQSIWVHWRHMRVHRVAQPASERHPPPPRPSSGQKSSESAGAPVALDPSRVLSGLFTRRTHVLALAVLRLAAAAVLGLAAVLLRALDRVRKPGRALVRALALLHLVLALRLCSLWRVRRAGDGCSSRRSRGVGRRRVGLGALRGAA